MEADTQQLRVFYCTTVQNKKKLFEKLSEILSEASGCSFEKVLDSLTSRERMGSTCIGEGVAIPHCKLKIDKPIGAIILLNQAIDCGNKNEKVSLIFGLLIPEDQCQDHLSLLSGIASNCRTGEWLAELKSQQSEESLKAFLSRGDINLEPFINENSHS